MLHVLRMWLILLVIAVCSEVALGGPISQADLDAISNAAAVGIAQGEAQSATTMPMTPAAKVALAGAVAVVTLAVMSEALGAAAGVAAAISEGVGIGAALGAGIAAGGLGLPAAVIAIGVIGITIALAIGVAATIIVTAPRVADGLNRSHPVSPRSQSGEQTDFSEPSPYSGQLNVQVFSDPSGGIRSFSIPAGRPGLLDDLDLNNDGGQSNVAPTLGLELTLNPVGTPTLTNPVASDLVDMPGAMPDPGDINSEPGACCDAPGTGAGDVGLMMAFTPAVSTIPTLLMLGLGGGYWLARRRRWGCSS
jgi:hypothetical protein